MKLVILRILVLLFLLSALFFAIEILPLHYGQQHIPWSNIPAIIRQKLPRFAIVAVLVVGVLIGRGLGAGKKDA